MSTKFAYPPKIVFCRTFACSRVRGFGCGQNCKCSLRVSFRQNTVAVTRKRFKKKNTQDLLKTSLFPSLLVLG